MPELAVSILDELPSSVIAQIVHQLNPRLYIDFIRYLPAEICLKILGYLDPLSLISVARSCRAWYELALDRKLREKLYYMEGWKCLPAEIQAWEDKINQSASTGQLQRFVTSEDGHAHKKRAISTSPQRDHDHDCVMLDADRPLRQEPKEEDADASMFGGSSGSGSGFARSSMTPGMSELNMDGSGSSWGSRTYPTSRAAAPAAKKSKTKTKTTQTTTKKHTKPNKNRTDSLPEMFPSAMPGSVTKSKLWMWDTTSKKYRLNWKYLYSMRRRLESNWELGKFSNFQFAHPDHLDEGHNECIYSIQFNSQYLVSGSRDRTLRIWNMQTRRLVRPPLTAHHGSVLCLQFDSDPDEDIIVSDSSDSDVILWRFSTGQVIQRLSRAHRESVLNVKIDRRILVTCSKDKTIKIFNRRDLKPGDLGYVDLPVNPVPIQLKNYGYDGLDQLPIRPAFSLIGSLEGHSAAVNAVQICGREVVSASGDRNVKIWDWPNQTCLRTFVGHNKGIACVQYDGKRIVSGSSDNEVKVFDRQSGVEVASLRSHSNLVRTVQAGFGDLPYSTAEDAAEAAKVDQQYFKAVEMGRIQTDAQSRRHHRPANAGSRRPEDIIAYGAKLPPGGGGGKYGRIVSGAYDTSIIIWRRDKEGIWKDQHHLKLEEAAAAAAGRAQPAGSTARRHVARLPGPAGTAPAAAAAAAAGPLTAPAAPAPGHTPAHGEIILHPPGPLAVDPAYASTALLQLIDNVVPQGVHTLQQTLAQNPGILSMEDELQTAINREASPFVRSQLRQAVSTAKVRYQLALTRAIREGGPLPGISSIATAAAGSSSAAGPSGSGDSGSLTLPPITSPQASTHNQDNTT